MQRRSAKVKEAKRFYAYDIVPFFDGKCEMFFVSAPEMHGRCNRLRLTWIYLLHLGHKWTDIDGKAMRFRRVSPDEAANLDR